MIRRITLICLVVMAAVALSQFSSSEFHATTLEVKEPVTARIGPDERAVLAFLRSRHTGLSRFEEVNVARAVVREARRNDLDPDLVLAVIQVESGGYNLAASHVGALGLMQLLPSTAEELARHLGLDWRGPDSLFDPVLNITLGTAYIKQLENRYGDVSTALAAYNWGPGRIDRRIRTGSGVPSIYRDRVMKALDVSQIRRANLPTSG